MMLTDSSVIGLPELSLTNRGVKGWQKRLQVPLHMQKNYFTVSLSDLSAPVRLAYVQREIAAAGLAAGTHDDAAHERLAGASAGLRAEAERKAGIARLLVSAGKAMTWPQKAALVRARFGTEGTSDNSLMRIAKAVEGVDPINSAPVLLADYSASGAPRADTCAKGRRDEKLWQRFAPG